MNHNPQKIPRVSPYEIWYYYCASTTEAIIDLQLETTASAQRCGITYSGRCGAEASCQKSIGFTPGDFMTVEPKAGGAV
jgi:hypothetical protein